MGYYLLARTRRSARRGTSRRLNRDVMREKKVAADGGACAILPLILVLLQMYNGGFIRHFLSWKETAAA